MPFNALLMVFCHKTTSNLENTFEMNFLYDYHQTSATFNSAHPVTHVVIEVSAICERNVAGVQRRSVYFGNDS